MLQLWAPRTERRTPSRSVDKESAATLSARSQRARAQAFFQMWTHEGHAPWQGRPVQSWRPTREGNEGHEPKALVLPMTSGTGRGPTHQIEQTANCGLIRARAPQFRHIWRAPMRHETRHPSCDHLLGALARTRRHWSGTEPETRRKRASRDSQTNLRKTTWEEAIATPAEPCWRATQDRDKRLRATPLAATTT